MERILNKDRYWEMKDGAPYPQQSHFIPTKKAVYQAAVQVSRLAPSIVGGHRVVRDGGLIFDAHEMYFSHRQFSTFHLTTQLARCAGKM